MALPTVASLCSTLGKHLSPVDGFRARDVEIAAVHISELVDPNAYLSGGELLLTTGLALPKNDIGCRRYVARLMEAGVSALAIGLGPVHDAPPPPLIAACHAAGLTLLTVPGPTPFLTISRAYWTARSRETEQQLSDAVAAHRALVDAAVAPDPAAAILRRLARLLEGWAALLETSGEMDQAYPVSISEHAEALRMEVGRLHAAGVHSSASFSLGEYVVVLYPLAVQNAVVGYLAAGSPRQLEPTQRRVVLTAAALLSLDVVRHQRSESAERATRRAAAVLVEAGMVEAARMLAAESSMPRLREEVTILVARGQDSDKVAQAVERWCPSVLTVAVDRMSAWFLVPEQHEFSDLENHLHSADRSASAIVSELTAISRVSPARARLMRALASTPPGVVVLPRPPGVEGLRDAVDMFLSVATEEVRESLVAYLRYRGQWEHASRALGLHRNTIRYRVERAKDILKLDLDDPDVAAEAWLALRVRGAA